ncbi:uncharacterized protein LOC100892550 [Strongylocentrotus purpuratus]|uniref:Uncharacterized protein n=1 Tax=Strongylocentrotus purpuratus TaxID=7668 RepID=A0A7M7PRP4_STRPU|nr:uncharacterized protein LOC100892550 [Strongylocentrotus purpuratus]
MEKLDVKLSAIFGLSLFGTLSVISAIGLVTVGIYAILEEGIVLSIKTPLWVGGAVFIGGILTIGIALCGKISYLKSLILIVISGASFLLCFASMLLLEFAEKMSIFLPARHDHSGPVSMDTRWRSPYVIYLVYLVSSVVGMVSALVGFLYIYCLLIAPVRNRQWKLYQTQSEATSQDQTQTETKNQDQAPEQHARTKYKFKNTPSSKDNKDKISMKSRGRHGSDLPETSWIYDSQSIHSLVATPTKAFPTEKETQLKKDVVDELRHTSSFKIHRYQTLPTPSPVPPPLPPINPSALYPRPTPPEQVKNDVLDDPEPKHCTAKSLEHYPIPRKYSLRGSKRGSKHGRQHPSTFRQISPQGHNSPGEGAVNVTMEHHQGFPDVSEQNFGKGHDQGNIDEYHNTFSTHTSPRSPTDQKFAALSDEARPLQTLHQNASDLISLKPVPVKRLCSKRNSMHHQSAATLPGYDQITLDPPSPQHDSVHCDDQCCLPLPPVQFQENGMTHQKPVRHFNDEVSDNKHSEAAQKGYTDINGHPWEVHQGQGESTDQKTHPVPSQRAAHATESVCETEAPQMTPTQVHQLYQSSQNEETKLDAKGQHNLNQQGYIVIQNPSTHCDTSTDITDPSSSFIEQRSDKPVAPPRTSPKPKLQHQSHVEEATEGPLPVLHRRSSRKVHERIQAVQKMLGMGSSNADSSDHPIDQSPPVPKDEVDHLQPRLAATKVQLDNLEDLYVTSTRL